MLQFILERYNYWIVIILMMTGLYIVFSRGNLVKKIIGLNIFQTSVFIFYITIGKIAGGTAPIFVGGHGDSHGGGDHGSDHHPVDASHADTKSLNDLAHANDADHTPLDEVDLSAALPDDNVDSLHDKVGNAFDKVPTNDLKGLLTANGQAGTHAEIELHDIPEELVEKLSNTVLEQSKAGLDATQDLSRELDQGAKDIALDLVKTHEQDGHGAAAGDHVGDTAADGVHHGAEVAADIIYTNPLPHVLILTAIVVGVATTAVGLALAVRIREAYGTIEEDELEAADDIAEFGEAGSYVAEGQG